MSPEIGEAVDRLLFALACTSERDVESITVEDCLITIKLFKTPTVEEILEQAGVSPRPGDASGDGSMSEAADGAPRSDVGLGQAPGDNHYRGLDGGH